MFHSILLSSFLVACGEKTTDTAGEPASEASTEPSSADTGSTEGNIDALEAGDLIITEIMKNPCVLGDDVDGDGNQDCTLDDEFGEWFEIYNNTSTSQNLNGLVVADDDLPEETFTVTEDVVVEAGSYIVLGTNNDSTTNGGYTAGYVYVGGDSGFKLGNGTDGIVLSNTTGTIDSVIYNDDAFPDTKGYSLSLVPNILDTTQNDDGSNWCMTADSFGAGDFGTPGEPNTCE